MKLVGMYYLYVMLKFVIEEICQSYKFCEIDFVKLKDGENFENNMENLWQYVDCVFYVIIEFGVSCLIVMCDIFFLLWEVVVKCFQGDLDVRYIVVSSFIFLRFFVFVIFFFNFFQFMLYYMDFQMFRMLMLIFKIVQIFGSLFKFKFVSFKEFYMVIFYEFFNEQKYVDVVKNFLDLILFLGRRDFKSVEQFILFKEGFMIKRV